MKDFSREIEIKYRIQDTNLDSLWLQIKRASLPLGIERTLEVCKTQDVYFLPPASLNIVRLRDSWGVEDDGFSKSLKEITVKRNDKGDTFNRIEENVKIENSAAAYRSLLLMFGPPLLTLYKDERILFTKDGMVLSLASVSTHLGATDTLFLEIEGPTEKLVQAYAQDLEERFEMYKEPRSLFEIYGPAVH